MAISLSPRHGPKIAEELLSAANLCSCVEKMKVNDSNEVAACEKHLTKLITHICVHCKVTVCEECIKVSHKSHKTILIQEFKKEMSNQIPKLKRQAEKKLEEIYAAVDVVEETRKVLQQKRKMAIRETAGHAHKLIHMISQACAKMKGEIEKKYLEKEKAIVTQLDTLDTAQREIMDLISLQEPSEEESSMTGSVMTASGLHLWIQLNQMAQQDLQLAPIQNVMMSVELDRDLERNIQRETLGRVVTNPMPSSHHSLLSLSPSCVNVNSEVKIQLAVKDCVGSTICTGNVSTLLATVSAPGSFTSPVQFTAGDAGHAVATFTPKYIGRYKIDGEMFDKPVKNSPQNLIVKPRGTMKINERCNFKNPHDIIQHEDNFYITDKGNHQVIIMDRQFKLVGRFLVPSDPKDQKLEPFAIAYTGKTFVVTEPKKKCVLEFRNTSLLQRFGQGVLSKPTGIACDKNGKVYVADCEKHCIFVFDQVREKIAVLGSPGATEGQFNTPWFIDVNSKGEVVVADCGNHRIQVVDPIKDEVTRLINIRLNQKVWDVRGLTVDRHDNIYATIRQSGNMSGLSTETVIAYSPEGVLLGNFGDKFDYVRGMTIIEDGENMTAMVVDGANHRIKGYLM